MSGNSHSPLRKSTFSVPKMDCPSEENLIRMALGNNKDVQKLSFNLAARELEAIHSGSAEDVLSRLEPLKLGATLRQSDELRQPVNDGQYHESKFIITKMDCPSEENLIRMALSGASGVQSLKFDLSKRELTAVHQGEPSTVLGRLQPLQLGASLAETRPLDNTFGSARIRRTTFSVPKMDCPSEENLIRMAVGDMQDIRSLSFDLTKREVAVIHEGEPDSVLKRLESLNLGAVLLDSVTESEPEAASANDSEDAAEAKTLRILLLINALMFFFELTLGLVAESTGLIADSLDMFADAAVYGLALYAVGRAAAMKTRAAHLAGWLQLLLAMGALSEVIRRFIFGSEPESALMMGVGLIALAANVTCLVLISKKRDRGAHMKASYIFSANDVIANLGVIAAGVLVAWTQSPYPDLIIGTIIGVIVLNGARRILQLR